MHTRHTVRAEAVPARRSASDGKSQRAEEDAVADYKAVVDGASEEWVESLFQAEQARDAWRWGAVKLKEGQFEEAVEALDIALDLFRSSASLQIGIGPRTKAQVAVQARVLQDLGHAKCRLGLLEEGLADLESANDLEPDNKSFLTMLGAVNLELDRPEQALVHFERVAALSGGAGPGYFTLTRMGVARYRLGKFREAVWALDRAAKAQTMDADALTVRGEAKRELGQLKDALADFDAALGRTPDHVGALRARGELRIDLQKFSEALEDLSLAESLRPGDAVTVVNAARALLAMGRVGEALVELDHADGLLRSPAVVTTGVPGSPGFSSAALTSLRVRTLLLRGQAKLALGKEEEGLADLEAANSLQPKDPRILQNLGEAEMQLGWPA